ncbi:MAG TPA: hypothetical protein VE093_11115 [Polyangiaceae bacterium]|jgi:hypothetical protein|nr:hypothetical protein [Polyangiaceae bacterium]
MPTSFKTASVMASFMMVLLSGLMALALAVAHIPFLFLGMAILSGFLVVISLISLISLGMSLMMSGDVKCPRCGQGCEIRVRMSGRVELH